MTLSLIPPADDLRAQLADKEAELARYRAAIARVGEVCAAAARGDLEPRLLRIDDDGELGEMMHQVNHLLDLTDAFVRESSASLEGAAEGRFHRRFLERGMLGSFRAAARKVNAATEVMREGAVALERERASRLELADELKATIFEIVSSVASASTEVRANADELSRTAQAASEGAEQISAAASDASRNLEAITDATDRMTESAGGLASRASESSQIARRATESAAQTSDTVAELETASNRITSVVKIITRVADQTRLLALNANIEAARAGAAGAGFKVVANEVKDLANQTSAATAKIEQQIESIQRATGDATEAIRGIGETVGSVAGLANEMENSVADQRDTTLDLGQSLSEAVERTREVSAGLHEVTRTAADTRDASAQMLEASDELSRLAETLRGAVIDLVDRIRQ